MAQTWQKIQKNEVRFKEYYLDDAQFLVIGFGSAGRVALSAVRQARAEGIRIGLLRPVSLSPFPEAVIEEMSRKVEGILVVEMNSGQMLEDVRQATHNQVPIDFFARLGGVMPLPDEVMTEIQRMVKGPRTLAGHPRDRWLERAINLN
jgi:2-oxoglutarate ferredoxin oxidoreductase subunit alpha